MELNFYDQFKEYSNTELLKIVNRPQGYQSAAIEAASEILKSRQVSEEEILVTENYFVEKDEYARLKRQRAESIKNNVADFLEPIIQPGPAVDPNKWINLFLVVIALEYLRAIFIRIKNIIVLTGTSRDSFFYFSIFYEVVYIIYIPVLFYLLYKKRRWGWILLFGDQSISLLFSISNTYFIFKYPSAVHAQIASWLFWTFLRGAFIYFLWQDKMVSYFNVPKHMKEKTVMGSILLFLVIMSFLKIYFY